MNAEEKLTVIVDGLQCGGRCICPKGKMLHCPKHDPNRTDKTPSLSVAIKDGEVVWHCFNGCSQADVADALVTLGLWGGGGSRTSGKSSATLQPLSLEEYSEEKQLPLDFLKELGLTEIYVDSVMCVRTPFPLTVQFRYKNGKRWRTGQKQNICRLYYDGDRSGDDYTVAVEGASDTQTLWFNNIPAVGLPSASDWIDERDAPYFEKFKTIYVHIEPDNGGIAVRKSFSESVLRDRVMLITMPEGFKDPSDMWVNDPSKFAARWQRAIDAARSLAEVEREKQAEVLLEQWNLCKDIATLPNILDALKVELAKHHLAEEDRNAQITYLELVSRLLKKPINLTISGPTSSGKTIVPTVTCRFFPEHEAWEAISSMSDHALIYLDDISFKHKILIVYELAGMISDKAKYFVRTLQSEGHIKHMVSVKDELTGKRITKMIEVEGPAGVLVTTTQTNIHSENDTRHLTLHSNDSPEATRGSMIGSARKREEEGLPDTSQWIALARWTALANHKVTLAPWSENLAKIIDSKAPRMRRDYDSIVDLITSHAILHQATREIDQRGWIIATRDDYETVADLVDPVISTGLGLRVRRVVRETVAKVEELLDATPGKVYVTQSELVTALDITKSSVSHRVSDALQIGYLKNLNPKKVPYELAIGEPMPDDKTRLIPSWEELTSSRVADETGKVQHPPPPPEGKSVVMSWGTV